MSGKKKKQQRDLLSFWAVEGQPPPAKLARSEETVEEALDLSVNDRAEKMRVQRAQRMRLQRRQKMMM
ncbi:G polyprotein [Dissostichus eleginoides]|uniref:G polyprotein n=1 Tax=Dissostichus eleginoides TaxID=100907 RepID=A0AAD9EMW9_DISEL|nr:G polyprotein [Dissostichus eleginoides]